jgi:hypothetical protein
MFRFLLGLVLAIFLLIPASVSAGGIVPRRVEVVQYYYPSPAPVVTSYYYALPVRIVPSYSYSYWVPAPPVPQYAVPAAAYTTYYYGVPGGRYYSTTPWPGSNLILFGP